MRKQDGALALAMGAALGSGAEAAVYPVTLVDYTSYSNSGSVAAALGSSTATWEYDSVNGLLTQAGGTFDARFTIIPTTTLFRHSTTGLVLGAGQPAAATAFTCTEGNFGANVSASICGNYRFGTNFLDESTATWGPGTATSRTIGGDDMALGPQQSVADYDGFVLESFNGTTLVLSNAACIDYPPQSLVCAELPPELADYENAGYRWTLEVVAGVPVAADGAIAIDTAGVDPASQSGDLVVVGGTLGNLPGDEPAQPVTFSDPPRGSVTLVGGTTLRYVPDADFFAGADSFTYTLTDANGDTDTATVTVTLADATPALAGASAETPAGTAVDLALLPLATPGNGAPAQHAFAVAADAAHGGCAVAGTTLTYTPADGYSGSDQCDVQISDGDGSTAAATVDFTVTAPPDDGSGLRDDDGGSAADLLVLALLAGGAARRRRG